MRRGAWPAPCERVLFGSSVPARGARATMQMITGKQLLPKLMRGAFPSLSAAVLQMNAI